jgi:hypothetical protein
MSGETCFVTGLFTKQTILSNRWVQGNFTAHSWKGCCDNTYLLQRYVELVGGSTRAWGRLRPLNSGNDRTSIIWLACPGGHDWNKPVYRFARFHTMGLSFVAIRVTNTWPFVVLACSTHAVGVVLVHYIETNYLKILFRARATPSEHPFPTSYLDHAPFPYCNQGDNNNAYVLYHLPSLAEDTHGALFYIGTSIYSTSKLIEGLGSGTVRPRGSFRMG